jgi:hypothetical protein
MNPARFLPLAALAMCARTARTMAHCGEWLTDQAEALENALDRLTAKAGYTVEEVYAPMRSKDYSQS